MPKRLEVALNFQIRLIVISVCGSSQPPEVWWKVLGYIGKDAEEVSFEVACGYLGCIASVATWWHQFHIQFARVTNMILHVFRYLIVKDIFLGDNAGLFELEQECVVCPYHCGILAVFHGFNEDGDSINLHHNYDVCRYRFS
jgi:hypothetical protein